MQAIGKKAASETVTLDDLLRALHLLPDDPAGDTAQLATALMADLAPKSAFEKIIAANLVDIEIERQRLKRWIRELIRDATWCQIRTGLRSKHAPETSIKLLATEWESGEGRGLAAAIQEHGISINHAVAHARSDRAAQIRAFESDLRNCEQRRRLLLRDLKTMRDERRPAIPDAEVVG